MHDSGVPARNAGGFCVTYRIVNITIITAGSIMAGLILLFHVLGMGQCGLQAYNGGTCLLCGCTRDFFRLLHGDCHFQNPYSAYIFIGLMLEFIFRLIMLFVRQCRIVIIVDIIIHVVVVCLLQGWNVCTILKSTQR